MGAKTKHKPVWEMDHDQFGAFAAGFSGEQIAHLIREAHKQAVGCLKRGAEWYYAAGRWLGFVRNNHLYGDNGWEAFCRKQCGLSPSQAWKYMTFAAQTDPATLTWASFANERFSLEKALGYKHKPTGQQQTTTPPKHREQPNQTRLTSQTPELDDNTVPISFIVNCNLPQSLYDRVARDGTRLRITFAEGEDIEAEACQFEMEKDEDVALPE